MNIAFFADSFYPELSGISDSIIETGKELSLRGHHVEFFVPSYSAKEYLLTNATKDDAVLFPEIKVNRLLAIPFPAPTLQGRAVIPNIFRGISLKKKFDIVHSHGFFGAGIDALFYSKMTGIPLVGSNHTLIKSFLKYSPIKSKNIENAVIKYMNWYYDQCGTVVTPSDFLGKDMKNQGLKNETIVISNPIQDNFYNQTETKDFYKNKYGLSKFVILYVGRLSIEKNINDLILSFTKTLPQMPLAQLVIIGQGALRNEIKIQIDNLNLGDKIKIMGPYVGESKESLYEIFHASDIFVMPSTSETQCMAAMQAGASLLPVIAANSGALPETVKSEYGLLYNVENLDELSVNMLKFYNDTNLCKAMGEAAYKNSIKFNVKSVATQWEKLYEIAIHSHKKGVLGKKKNILK